MIDLARSMSEETREREIKNGGKNLNGKGMGYTFF